MKTSEHRELAKENSKNNTYSLPPSLFRQIVVAIPVSRWNENGNNWKDVFKQPFHGYILIITVITRNDIICIHTQERYLTTQL